MARLQVDCDRNVRSYLQTAALSTMCATTRSRVHQFHTAHEAMHSENQTSLDPSEPMRLVPVGRQCLFGMERGLAMLT